MKVRLEVIKGPHQGRRFEFDQHDTFIVGRAKQAQFRLSSDDRYFSRNHFLIEVNPPLCRLIDLNSRNGTYVNGKRVSQVDLKQGDRIKGGKTILEVSIEGSTPVHQSTRNAVGMPTSPKPLEGEVTFTQGSREQRSPDQDESKTPLIPSNSPLDAETPTGLSDSGNEHPPDVPGYEIVQLIGRGGMGRVYLGRSQGNGEMVAIKVVKPAVEAGDAEINRFLREAEILKSLRHDHIVSYRDLVFASGELCILMDYIDGTTVSTAMEKASTPLGVKAAVRITLQLVDALAYAHDRGYVHRDVKPSNLILQKARPGGPKVYLADFGLARTYQSSKLSGLTVTGEIGGTTSFMPPEQITNYRNAGPAADQYSTAATLYYLLTKQPIYELPKDIAKQLLLILQEPPVSIESRRPDLPNSVQQIIHRGLARSPGERFRNIAEFGMALRESVGDHT